MINNTSCLTGCVWKALHPDDMRHARGCPGNCMAFSVMSKLVKISMHPALLLNNGTNEYEREWHDRFAAEVYAATGDHMLNGRTATGAWQTSPGLLRQAGRAGRTCGARGQDLQWVVQG